MPVLRTAFITVFVGCLACLPACLPCQGGRAFLRRPRGALRRSAGSRPALQEVGGHVGKAALNLPISPQPPAAQGGGAERKPLAAGGRLRAAVFIAAPAVSCNRGASQLGRWGCAGAGGQGWRHPAFQPVTSLLGLTGGQLWPGVKDRNYPGWWPGNASFHRGSSAGACCPGVLSVTVVTVTAASVHCALAMFLGLNSVFSYVTRRDPYRKCWVLFAAPIFRAGNRASVASSKWRWDVNWGYLTGVPRLCPLFLQARVGDSRHSKKST